MEVDEILKMFRRFMNNEAYVEDHKIFIENNVTKEAILALENDIPLLQTFSEVAEKLKKKHDVEFEYLPLFLLALSLSDETHLTLSFDAVELTLTDATKLEYSSDQRFATTTLPILSVEF